MPPPWFAVKLSMGNGLIGLNWSNPILDYHYKIDIGDCQGSNYGIIISVPPSLHLEKDAEEGTVETSLLRTKLFVPPPKSGLVSRPRLMESMQSILKRSLTLISAPAGFGKTTLMAEWIRYRKPSIPTVWLSLEESDNEPRRFWEYIMAAIKTNYPDAGSTASALLHSQPMARWEPVITELINGLGEIDEDFVLVLDDYHFISSGPIHDGIALILQHMPPRMHLVIITRMNPPLSLARLRANDNLVEIRADDLRFSVEETKRLFRELRTPDLGQQDLRALCARTEGWVAGLKMAGLSIQGKKDISRLVAGFTGSQVYVMDFLLEEVLKKQPSAIQEFLLLTSILERLSGPLCDAVTGGCNGGQMLLELEKSNLFLVPLDTSRQWYRYEHLFAELLRHQLISEYGKDKTHDLRIRASQWCESQNLQEDAIQQAIAAQDWKRVIRLIDQLVWPRIQRGEVMTLLKWFGSLPEDVLRAHPETYLAYGWALVGGDQLDPAESVFSYLDQTFPADRRFQGKVAVGRTSLARARGDTAGTREQAEKALALLPADAVAARGNICSFLGTDYIDRQLFVEAEPLLKEACQSYRRTGAVAATIFPLTLLGVTETARGELHKAMDLFRQGLAVDGQAPASAFPHACLASGFYQWNDLQKSEDHLQQAMGLCRRGGYPEVLDLAYLHLARLRLAQGDEAAAAEALEKADDLLTGPSASSHRQAHHAALHFLLAKAQKDSEGASRWLEKLSGCADSLPIDIPPRARRLVIARSGEIAAKQEMEAAYAIFARKGLKFGVLLVRLFQSLASPRPAEAVEYLAEALALGRPEGYIRVFVDEGTELAPLLVQAVSEGIELEYSKKLLDLIESEERRRLAKIESQQAAPTAAESLSLRELEVLRLLAEGLSNQQIAARLFVSLNTVKTHILHIYEKMSSRSRTQAIARARELKLL